VFLSLAGKTMSAHKRKRASSKTKIATDRKIDGVGYLTAAFAGLIASENAFSHDNDTGESQDSNSNENLAASEKEEIAVAESSDKGERDTPETPDTELATAEETETAKSDGPAADALANDVDAILVESAAQTTDDDETHFEKAVSQTAEIDFSDIVALNETDHDGAPPSGATSDGAEPAAPPVGFSESGMLGLGLLAALGLAGASGGGGSSSAASAAGGITLSTGGSGGSSPASITDTAANLFTLHQSPDGSALLSSAVSVTVIDAPTVTQALDLSQLPNIHFDVSELAASGEVMLGYHDAVTLRDVGLFFAQDTAVTVDMTSQDVSGAIGQAAQLHAFGIDSFNVHDDHVSISESEAAALVEFSIDFTSSSDVCMQVDGTHLQTTFQDLQTLGVDTITALAPGFGVYLALGGGTLSTNSMPAFDPEMNVTLGVGHDHLGEVVSHAGALHDAGIDQIDVACALVSITEAEAVELVDSGLTFTVDNNVVMLAEGTSLQTTLQDLHHLGVDMVSGVATPGYFLHVATGHGPLPTDSLPVFDSALDVTLDIEDGQHADVMHHAYQLHNSGIDHLSESGLVVLSETDASMLIDTGLDYVAHDAVQLEVCGTHLQSTFGDLQALGVDSVVSTHGTVLTVDLGTNVPFPSSHPLSFDSVLDVTLKLDASQLDLVLDQATCLNVAEVDRLSVVSTCEETLSTRSGSELVTALADAGIADLHIDSAADVKLSDLQAGALLDAGVLTVDQAANVVIEHQWSNGDPVQNPLEVTLADLASIGADHVAATGGSELLVDLGIDLTNAGMNAELESLLSHFAQGASLFDASDVVTLDLGGANVNAVDATVVEELKLLGIDDLAGVDDLGNHADRHLS
jgi:hypothetical protein